MASLQQPPSEYLCAMTKKIMQEPMRSKHGFHFERQAIEGWMSAGNHFCPVSGKPLSHSCLVPNKTLQWSIQSWAADSNIQWDEFHGNGIGPKSDAPPPCFCCPLTQKCMEDPVITKHGINFERSAILAWLKDHGYCPVTSKPLSSADLSPDTKLQAAFDEWVLNRPSSSSTSSHTPFFQTFKLDHSLTCNNDDKKMVNHFSLPSLYSDEKVNRFKRRFATKEDVVSALNDAVCFSSYNSKDHHN
jgi:U-box domain